CATLHPQYARCTLQITQIHLIPQNTTTHKHNKTITRSKLVRRKKEIGAALIVALQLATVTLTGLMLPFGNGPQPVKAPADSQMSAPAQTAQAPMAIDRSALRASAVYANKVDGPRATEVFNLAASRAASAESTLQS